MLLSKWREGWHFFNLLRGTDAKGTCQKIKLWNQPRFSKSGVSETRHKHELAKLRKVVADFTSVKRIYNISVRALIHVARPRLEKARWMG